MPRSAFIVADEAVARTVVLKASDMLTHVNESACKHKEVGRGCHNLGA